MNLDADVDVWGETQIADIDHRTVRLLGDK